MDNPFLKRATEQYRGNHEAFLAVVSPAPITRFLAPLGAAGELYDRLLIFEGTPGSGKTTIAQIFEYQTLAALLRNANAYRDLHDALVLCGAVSAGHPQILGCRLSLETDYRECWEFPYPSDVKLGLMVALIQARAVLAWSSNLVNSGFDLSKAHVVPRRDAAAATGMIGGTGLHGISERAREVELSIYQIIAALVPPTLDALSQTATGAYRPLDVIEKVHLGIDVAVDGGQADALTLTPLVILDDAHTLHPEQFNGLRRWLARREVGTARWVMTRFDALAPAEAIALVTEERHEGPALPGITKDRDFKHVPLQGVDATGSRREGRLAFRRMARDMANRYLHNMAIFHSRGLRDFTQILSTKPPSLSPAKRKELERHVNTIQSERSITDARRQKLSALIDEYDIAGSKVPGDVRLGILSILMNRYVHRTPQTAMFDFADDPEPSRPLRVESDMVEAARVLLFHQFGLPLFYGIDNVCDASSENAEQFLHLAATLVEQSAVQLIRSKPATLDAAIQHQLLRERARSIIEDWNFPHFRLVQQLVREIGVKCVSTSTMPRTWIGAGANAFGIPQDQFDTVSRDHPDLARVLQFAVAYNAISLVPRYPCKQKSWCLIELGGLAILEHGLTFHRGGFLEGGVNDLCEFISGVTK